MITVYVIRMRDNNSEPWGPKEFFKTRQARDRAGAMARIIYGKRTHSFEEKLPRDVADDLFADGDGVTQWT